MAALSADRLISCGIQLLEVLSAAPGQRCTRTAAAQALHVDVDAIPQIVDTVSALSDRTSGARVALTLDGETLSLTGDAALIMPRRFSLEESMVLAHILDVLNLDEETREHVRAAVMPLGEAPEKARIAEPARYGAWFGKLSEAIEDGIRCRMTYRSLEDDAAHERIIDPIAVTEEHGETYLIAWNVEKDAERRYRLDRIQDVTFTEDSIEQHGAQLMDTAASLRESGQHVRLAVPSLAYLQRLDWAGIGEIAEEPDGSATCTLFFDSKHWLFDQLLSAGGDIVLLDASELAGELAAYAEELLASVDR